MITGSVLIVWPVAASGFGAGMVAVVGSGEAPDEPPPEEDVVVVVEVFGVVVAVKVSTIEVVVVDVVWVEEAVSIAGVFVWLLFVLVVAFRTAAVLLVFVGVAIVLVATATFKHSPAVVWVDPFRQRTA